MQIDDILTEEIIEAEHDRLILILTYQQITGQELIPYIDKCKQKNRQQTWKGQRLGYQFIAFNPLNPKRYVVVTGMNAWAALPEWKLHPSRHGLCDYFIYDLSSPTPRLIDAGYFPAQVWK